MSRKAGLLIALAVLAFSASAAVAQDQPARPGGRNPDDASTRPRPQGEQPRKLAPLSDQQQKEMLEAIKRFRPEMYERLMKARQERPGQQAMLMRTMWEWYKGWKEWPEEVQKAAVIGQESRVRIVRIIEAFKGASDKQARATLVDRLRDAIRKRIEADITIQQYQLEQLQKRLERMRQELKERSEKMDQAIEGEVQSLLKSATQPPRTKDEPRPERRRRENLDKEDFQDAPPDAPND